MFTNLNNNAVVNKNGVVNENKKKINQGIDGWNGGGGGGGAATTSEAEASENVVSGLEERMAALEAALKSAKGGPGSAQGELAAMAAMNALQEKVKALEQAWGQRTRRLTRRRRPSRRWTPSPRRFRRCNSSPTGRVTGPW